MRSRVQPRQPRPWTAGGMGGARWDSRPRPVGGSGSADPPLTPRGTSKLRAKASSAPRPAWGPEVWGFWGWALS